MHDRSRVAGPRPRFSVVIPFHDGRPELSTAVDSVLKQTFEDFELIVVDNGSPVDPLDLLSGPDDQRLRIVDCEESGPGTARNAGITSARGEILTFLDSDDRAHENWLETIHEAFKPSVGLVCTAAIEETESGERKTIVPTPKGPAFHHQHVLFLAGTFAFRAELPGDALLYDPRLRFSENTEFGMRLVARCAAEGMDIRSIDEPLITISFSDRSTYGSDKIAAVDVITSEHDSLLQSDPAMGSTFASVAGVECARFQQWGQARSWFWKAARYQPLNLKTWGRLLGSITPVVRDRMWPPRSNA